MKQQTKEFKEEAVSYRYSHPDLSVKECATKLGIGESTLHKWMSIMKDGDRSFRGSVNYESDEAKELARVKRELRDTKDALEILKKAIGILGD